LKLNNKGFAISSIMYMIMILAVLLVTLTLTLLSGRKLILDKIKVEVQNEIYNIYSLSYREVINILKEEAVEYAGDSNKVSVKISDLNSSIDSEILDGYKLSDKYLTLDYNNSSYDVYLGQEKTITDISKPIDNMIDIIDYKIEGNTYQKTYTGKNLFNAKLWSESKTEGGLTIQYLEDEDCFLINGTATNAMMFYSGYINLPNTPGTQYTISTEYVSGTIDRTNGEGNKYAVAFFGDNDEIDKSDNWEDVHLQEKNEFITAISNKNYITKFWFYVSSGVSFNNYKVRIQLEKGATATEYEPYVGGVASPNPEYPSEIKSVGDEVKNLLPYPYAETKSKETSGIKWTLNEDRSITISGTATNYSGFNLNLGTINFEVGKKYYFKGDGDYSGLILVYSYLDENGEKHYKTSNSEVEIYWEQEHIDPKIYLQVNPDKTANGTIYPYLVAEEDQTFFYDIYGSEDKNIPIKVSSWNVLPYPYVDTTKTVNGITFTDNGDGSITIVGTATANANFILSYYKSFGDSMDAINGDSATNGTYTISKRLFYNATNSYLPVSINIMKGTTIDETIYPMIVEGSYTAKTMPKYEPYIRPVTTNIYLDEPLRKIGDYADSISLSGGKVIRKISESTFNGTEANWQAYGNSEKYYSYILPVDNGLNKMGNNCFCNQMFSVGSSANLFYGKEFACYFGNYNYTVAGFVMASNSSTLDQFKQSLNDNPIDITYVLAEQDDTETIELPHIENEIGSTKISIDTDIKPSSVEFTIIEKIKQI